MGALLFFYGRSSRGERVYPSALTTEESYRATDRNVKKGEIQRALGRRMLRFEIRATFSS
jgi:hypothetical protein